MSDLFVDSWGSGVPVVLVHGSLAIGADEWQAQRPLVEEGFRLLVPDRRGYGRSPAAEGEAFLRDADGSAAMRMKAAVRSGYGSPALLRVEDVERPTPGNDEVLVRVYATTVSRTAMCARAGHS